MTNLNGFKTTDAELIASKLSFNLPTVIAVEASKEGKGYNALIIQKMEGVPSSKEAKTPTNALLMAASNTSWEMSGGINKPYLGRYFKYYTEGEQPEVGQILDDIKLIIYDTINPSELEGIILWEKQEGRKSKTGVALTVGGNAVYRFVIPLKAETEFSHIVLKTDVIEDTVFSEIAKGAAKVQ